eukprot:scaffold15048_cov82-Skeletonema_marinoi.AAC.4
MNKYKKNREDLLLITYEGLTGRRGEIFTKQIASYLDKSEGINVIDPDSVPCIWEKFVHDKWYPNNGDESTATTISFQERADDRPLTQDQLRVVSRMLQSLDERFGRRDEQFSTIMNSLIHGTALAALEQETASFSVLASTILLLPLIPTCRLRQGDRIEQAFSG